MDNDELHEAIMKTSGPRAAIAALILAKDHDGARQYAQQLSHAELVTMALFAAHTESGGYLQMLEHQLSAQGKTPDEAAAQAREMAMTHYQSTAWMSAFRPDTE